MQALGRQILAEFYNCNSDALKDEKYIEDAMVQACIRGKATVVSHTCHSFSPYGVSGVVVIAESHVAIHTWPEYNYAAVDIFTCGETIEPWELFDYLKEKLGATHVSHMELKRGLFDTGGDKIKHKPDAETGVA